MSDYVDEFQEESFDKSKTGKILLRLIKMVKPVWINFFFIFFLMILVAFGEAYVPMVPKRVIDNGLTPSLLLDNTNKAIEGITGEPVQSVIDEYTPDYMDTIWGEVVFFLILWVFVALGVYAFIKLAGYAGEKITYLVRRQAFNHLQTLSFSYFDKTPVGWIMARMTSDIERFSEMLAWFTVDFVWGFSVIIMYMVIMFFMHWQLALIVVATVPLLWYLTYFFNTKILKHQREARKHNSQITRKYNEGINGVKVIKSLVQHERMHDEFKGSTNKMFKSSYKAGWFSALYIPLIVIVSSVALTLILVVGGNMAFLKYGVTVGMLVLFISYAQSFFEPLNQIAVILAESQRALASAERVISLLDTEPDIMDTEGAKDNGSIKGEIEFKDVYFAYEEDKYVLKDFNLKVKPGETIALVGPTGAGKSTVINLICRFYEPTKGQILIDGEDYRKRTLHSLQSKLGIVLQTPHLFSGTIKENIKYGKLDATDDEVIEASHMVNADKFIEKLPRAYDEDVGEGGNLLSTGEKQLVSFARAAIVNPQIFIMDEATSSVDTLTEQYIQEGMHRMLEGKTCFIIAHRLSTIKAADRIIVLKDGEIEEMGTHKELLIKKGHYYNLYTKQLREEREQQLGLVRNIEEQSRDNSS
jgi:ATP-binding cassette subfamily B protein